MIVPFDSLSLGNNLAQTIADLGIVPIPMDELVAYKAAEIIKHPPSIIGDFIEKQGILIFFIVNYTIIISSVIAFIFFCFTVISFMSDATLSPFCFIATFTFSLFASITELVYRGYGPKFRGSAKWTETYCQINTHHIPHPITVIARDVITLLPNCRLIIGTLIQNKTDLDPYLIVDHHGDKIVLGIWNDDGIIRIAGRY